MGQTQTVAGTPAYMAPEQITRGQATIQSDVYSLGLILYELFTGKAVHQPASLADLLRAHEESSPSQPSSLIEDMDPAVERVILRCLEKDPRQRPQTARLVAAALPGGDPLAAALAAGETPSPEMVAAAGATSGLSLQAGVLYLTALCALLVALPLVASSMEKNQFDLLRENQPAVLNNNAIQWVKRFGYSTTDTYSWYGFPGYREFRYRQSTSPLSPRITKLFGAGITPRVPDDNPSVLEHGMISVSLDPSQPFDSGAQLLEFLAVPESDGSGEESDSGIELDSGEGSDSSAAAMTIIEERSWETYFRALKLDPANFRELSGGDRPKDWRPPIYADDVSVWQAVDAAAPQLIMAVRDHQLVYFRRANAEGERSRFAFSPERIDSSGFIIILGVCFSGLLALHNLKLGRIDAKGSLHFTLYYFAAECLLGIFTIHHVADFDTESLLVANYLIYALARALRVWLYYVGFEPYVRRLWPNVLITWTRILSGRWRDPLVGRDLLVGCLIGALFALVFQLPGDRPTGSLNANSGVSMVALAILFAHQLGLIVAFYYLAFLLLCQVLARRTVFAVALFTAALTLNTMRASGFNDDQWDVWLASLAWWGSLAILYVRFGLVSAIACLVCHWLLMLVPYTTDLGAWYGVAGITALLTVLGLACFGFYTSTLAGRSFFGALEPEPR